MVGDLVLAGLIAGFIDSIAGGGGLITLPALSLKLETGPIAIGTNKICGSIAALVALWIYARNGHFDWKRAMLFGTAVGIGSFGGSRVAPWVPIEAFQWFMAITCPLLLWVIWRKDLWVARAKSTLTSGPLGEIPAPLLSTIAAGVAAGFYDGIWGPGGGTFMFLSLLFVAKQPLLPALASAKFANSASALVSLASYSSQGFVRWPEGLQVSAGIAIGAWVGATHANRNAARAVRPVLLVVVLILLARLITAWI